MNTNNFDELPETETLWINLDDDYTLKIYFRNEDQTWHEYIKKSDGNILNVEVFIKSDEDMDSFYLHHCISVYKVYCRQSIREDIGFAGRSITFGKDNDYKDTITIQIGAENDDGEYNIDMIQIDRRKWLEVAKFFNLCSSMYLNTKNQVGHKDEI
jgi:hypothetical protein